MPARRNPGQGSLRQRGDRWISQTRHPLTGRTVSKTHPAGTTPNKAEKLHTAWLAEIGRSRVARTGVTVAQHLDDWLATRDDLSPATLQTQRTNVKRIADRIGGVRLQDLGAGDIEVMLVDLRRHYAAGTVRITKSTLSAALSRAEAWGRIERNPMPHVARKRTKTQDEVIIPEFAQIVAMIDAEPDMLWRTHWALLWGSGCRAGEAMAMRWADVDLDGGLLHITRTMTLDAGMRRGVGAATKTRRARTVTIDEDTVATLRAWRAELAEHGGLYRARADAYLFESPKKRGQPYGAPQQQVRFRQALARVGGDPRCTPKSVRHAHATLLVLSGVPLTVVAERLGHSVTETADRYGRHVPSDVRRAPLAHLRALRAATDVG